MGRPPGGDDGQFRPQEPAPDLVRGRAEPPDRAPSLPAAQSRPPAGDLGHRRAGLPGAWGTLQRASFFLEGRRLPLRLAAIDGPGAPLRPRRGELTGAGGTIAPWESAPPESSTRQRPILRSGRRSRSWRRFAPPWDSAQRSAPVG